jgi:hypothetical protein
MGSVSAATRKSRQTFSHCSIEAFDKSRVQFVSPSGSMQKLCCLLKRALGHASDNFHDPFFGRFLDHCSNKDLWPGLQSTSPPP